VKKQLSWILPVLLFSSTACKPAVAQQKKSPVLSNQLSPAGAVAGSPSFNLTLYGSNFTGRCVVLWNGAQRPTKVMSGNQATATIFSTDIALSGTAAISMLNTNSGAQSNSVTFTVASATLTAPSSAVAVAVSPPSDSLPTGATQQFVATVTGTTNTAVAWSATGGSVDSTGLYVAPSTAGKFTITATSAADNTKSASATVTVTSPTSAVSVAINPSTTSVLTGGTVQFSAVVSGSTNTAVTWSTTGGTVSTAGLYTASSVTGSFTVTATSVADPTKFASAQVTVTTTVGITVSPTSVSLQGGATQQFTAAVTGSTNTSVTWSTSGGVVSSTGVYTAPSTAGTYTVTATSVADNTKSALATVTVSAPIQHSVTLSWVASTSTVNGYNIYRGTNSGGPYTQVNTALEPALNYVDNTVQSGQTYYYVATSVDGSGVESGFSNQVTATIPVP
jgi:uncharacterized protein YjdB